MQLIEYWYIPLSRAKKEISKIYEEIYSQKISRFDRVINLIDQIKMDCTLVAEFPYVDKVYRDSYYTYYSSKLNSYDRNSIRISIFSEKVGEDDFLNSKKSSDLKNSYLGFFTLRPISSSPIGRSTISPAAYKKGNFLSCKATIPSTCNGLKLTVDGFPYASQNAETISCAETTLWALMEYFSYRYAEYSPLLPSKIISILENISVERQLPSKGLNVAQLSYALKVIGFGTKMYSRKQFKGQLHNIISTYIESGIPIIVTLENNKVGHAVLCVGREQVDLKNARLSQSKSGISDFDEIDKNFIFLDDNYAPYQVSNLNSPTSYYTDPDFLNCNITNIVVPLYTKIYLEAVEAKDYAINFFKDAGVVSNNEKYMHRCFLMSSRSFKDSFVKSKTNTDIAKQIVQSCAMPKFIWVNELIDLEETDDFKSKHLLLLDATELTRSGNGLMLLSFIDDTLLTAENGDIITYKLNKQAPPFELITNNLTGF